MSESESQFAYSGLTLDELRSLAASPQVGTLHAMPQSFRALADRVGEVADLLTHTQLNMHNWWRGPAAEQAATMLGQAAAEAREFHDTAMAAATAVGHCAQIVSEQQHQMMNVPEVAEPGVTDVVRQPTTPFEALEAARQDAVYQAAHEQAVQVVNGIAAQYMETRSQLSNTNFAFFGENFTPHRGSNALTSHSESPPHSTSHSSSFESMRSLRPGDNAYRTSKATLEGATRFVRIEGVAQNKAAYHSSIKAEAHATGTPTWGPISQPTTNRSTTGNTMGEPALFEHPDRHANLEDIGVDYTMPSAASELLSTIKGKPSASAPNRYEPGNSSSRTDPSVAPLFEEAPNHTPPGLFDRQNAIAPDSVRKRYIEDRYTGASKVNRDTISTGGPAPNAQQPVYQSTRDGINGDDATMIPAFPGVGSVHRSRGERSRRPAYLTERKSTWLPKTIAAPPDGVLTPEWFEQH